MFPAGAGPLPCSQYRAYTGWAGSSCEPDEPEVTDSSGEPGPGSSAGAGPTATVTVPAAGMPT